MRPICRWCFLLLLIVLPATLFAQDARLRVSIVTDEADAILNILSKKTAGTEITTTDWDRLFSTEGYVRLKRRELAMSRPFTEDDFRTFVMSEDLLKRHEALAVTLTKWKAANLEAAGKLALAYLPPEATIKAKIYPVIKPRDNSFVFEVKTDPAIFLYLDPAVSTAKFGNTLAHELHHIGFGTACPPPAAKAAKEKLPERQQNALGWIGGFGEGFAMIAAAGGPDMHPHAVSDIKDRERWDKDVANFNADLKKVEKFLLDVANGKLAGDEMNKTGFEFFGVQGPWYTVGWKMAMVIEKTYGRKRLIDAFCDQRQLPTTYNRAVKKYNAKFGTNLATWSPELLKAL